MAKKQKRSRKNNAPERSEDSQIVSAVSDFSSQPLSQKQFVSVIGVSLGFFVYLALFLYSKTEFGDRLSTYLALFFNLDIYPAFWTGEEGGPINVLDRWPIWLGLMFHIALAIGFGYFLLGLLNWNSGYRFEHFLLAIGLGLAGISTYTVTIGLLQILAFKQLLVLPIIVVSVLGWRKAFTLRSSAWITTKKGDSDWTDWTWLAGIPFALFLVLASMIPPWEFDVREYHLQVPREWFQRGGVGFLPHNVYGNMPLGTEMHALFAMLYAFGPSDWWWGALIGKTVSGLFVVLNALAIYCLGRRLANHFAGVVGAVVYISTPWVIANGIIGYNESAMSLYLLLSLLVFIAFRFPKDGEGTSEELSVETTDTGVRGSVLLLGLMIGATIACKYTAIAFIAVPALILFTGWQVRTVGLPRALSGSGWICFGIILVSGVWLLKNLVLTGNPTYPLLSGVFQTDFRTESQIEQWARAHSPDSAIPTMATLASIFQSLFLSFKWLSPLTVPLVAVALLNRNKTSVFWLGGYLVLAFAIWLFLTHRLERFLLPFYPVACLLAGVGADWLPRKNWRTGVSLILIMGAGLNLLFSTSRLVGDARIFANMSGLDLRKLTARDYRHKDVIPLSHLSPTIAWLNQNHGDGKVLFFGECRPLSAEFQVIYNTCFDQCETWNRLSGRSADEFHQLLLDEGITHVLINVSELSRFQSTYGYNVEDGGKPVTPQDLVRLTGKVFRRVIPEEVPSDRDPSAILLEVEPR